MTVNQRVEDAASQVDIMMREFANALYINEAVSYISGETLARPMADDTAVEWHMLA